MSRYISVDDLQSYCDNQRGHSITPNEFQRMDSICIVRCKDCKWSWCLNPNDESPFYVCRHPTICNMRMSHEGNWYCGNGELKDGEQDAVN